MSKTQFRKDMDSELKDKLLLKNAGMGAISAHLIKRYHKEIIWVSIFIVGVIIGVVMK